MSNLAQRLRRLEAKAGVGSGRLVVVSAPVHASKEACQGALMAAGIAITPADLVVTVLTIAPRPSDGPKVIHNSPLR